MAHHLDKTMFMAVPVMPNGLERQMLATKEGTAGVMRGSYTSYRRFIMFMVNPHGVQGCGYNVYAKIGRNWVLQANQVVPRPTDAPVTL